MQSGSCPVIFPGLPLKFLTLQVFQMKNPLQREENNLYCYQLEWAERLQHVFFKWNVFQCADIWKGVFSSRKMRCIKKQYLLGEL